MPLDAQSRRTAMSSKREGVHLLRAATKAHINAEQTWSAHTGR